MYVVHFYEKTIQIWWAFFVLVPSLAWFAFRSTLAEDVDKSIYGSFVPLLENENTLSLRVVVSTNEDTMTNIIYPQEIKKNVTAFQNQPNQTLNFSHFSHTTIHSDWKF